MPFLRNTSQSCHNTKSFKESLLQRETLPLQREDQEVKVPAIISIFNAGPQKTSAETILIQKHHIKTNFQN